MPTTVILSAHGRLDRSSVPYTLPVKLTTSCRFGEVYNPKHLEFQDLSVFLDLDSLHRYIGSGKDYTTKGKVIPHGTPVNNVILTPFPRGDSAKDWSWQKHCVADHLRKMCIYELDDIGEIPFSVDAVRNTSLIDFRKLVGKDSGTTITPELRNHVINVFQYLGATSSEDLVCVDETHACSLTRTKDKSLYIFDYEVGPSRGRKDVDPVADNWNLVDALTGINHYLEESEGIPLAGIDGYILQACLA